MVTRRQLDKLSKIVEPFDGEEHYIYLKDDDGTYIDPMTREEVPPEELPEGEKVNIVFLVRGEKG